MVSIYKSEHRQQMTEGDGNRGRERKEGRPGKREQYSRRSIVARQGRRRATETSETLCPLLGPFIKRYRESAREGIGGWGRWQRERWRAATLSPWPSGNGKGSCEAVAMEQGWRSLFIEIKKKKNSDYSEAGNGCAGFTYVKLAHPLSTSGLGFFLKNLMKQVQLLLFHARGAVDGVYAIRRLRRPAGGPSTVSPLSFSLSPFFSSPLSLSLSPFVFPL